MTIQEELDRFGRSRLNSAYQGIVLPGNYRLHGQWDIEYLWRKFGLPENLEGKSILDLGCNIGGFSLKSEILGADRVLGIDKSKRNIEGANRLKEIACLSKSQFIQGNLTKELFAVIEGLFDIIYSFSVFQHTRNPVAILNCCFGLLAEGGILFCEIVNGPIEKKHDPFRRFEPTTETFCSIVRDIGFDILDSYEGRCVGREVFKLRRW